MVERVIETLASGGHAAPHRPPRIRGGLYCQGRQLLHTQLAKCSISIPNIHHLTVPVNEEPGVGPLLRSLRVRFLPRPLDVAEGGGVTVIIRRPGSEPLSLILQYEALERGESALPNGRSGEGDSPEDTLPASLRVDVSSF